MLEAFLTSTGVVALAEVGDKTQLLAILLAARYKKSTPIILGIFLATIVNHLFAAAVGQWLTALISPVTLKWILGIGFIAMAAWLLIPDKIDEDAPIKESLGIIGTTIVAFFIAEMGDKTQIATVALAAKYHAVVAVVVGSTLGMMIANVPAVLFGEIAVKKFSPKVVHAIAAVIFAIIGISVLLGMKIGL
ncbi:TMEM165/GDT1 family protein [Leeia sp. TBRC 13508]|uniref:GDT1 family protein n=1 Tax=Leeia speluncae TaxID=2884804 RepID=A0ABS8D626_9NEIS|nr:TMEM165/GDT1 family protein [Leeia speluncae]MCB6183653.1 TMEM165/GDT1 family protein [Leeia speluncae]